MKHTVLLCALLAGCGFWESAKPVLRTIADIALAQCEASAGHNPERLAGLTPAQWCAEAKNFAPFLAAQKHAAETAGGELGLARGLE